MLVKTVLVVNKEEVSINYLLLLDKNKWRIFDVLLAGSISEIATILSCRKYFAQLRRLLP